MYFPVTWIWTDVPHRHLLRVNLPETVGFGVRRKEVNAKNKGKETKGESDDFAERSEKDKIVRKKNRTKRGGLYDNSGQVR